MKHSTVFTFSEWHYTNANENLFDLDFDSYMFYKCLVRCAIGLPL